MQAVIERRKVREGDGGVGGREGEQKRRRGGERRRRRVEAEKEEMMRGGGWGRIKGRFGKSLRIINIR